MRQLQAWTDALGDQLKNWTDKNDFSMVLLTCLHQTIENCTTYLTGSARVKKEVPLVLRLHVQEVMRLLNETATRAPHSSSSSKNNNNNSIIQKRRKRMNRVQRALK